MGARKSLLESPVNSSLVWMYGCFGLVWVLAVLAASLDPDSVVSFTRKEGPVEIITHLVLVAAVCWHARDFWVRREAREHLLLALACLVILMEEVDWLQLYYGFDTPEMLIGHLGNSDRFNFHNTDIAHVLIPAAGLVYFFALPLLGLRYELGASLRRIGLLPLRPAFAFVFWMNRLATLLLNVGKTAIDEGEVLDLMISVQLLLVAAMPWVAFHVRITHPASGGQSLST